MEGRNIVGRLEEFFKVTLNVKTDDDDFIGSGS